MDVKVLSPILSHAQASTTLNLYAHALPDHKRVSMEKMRSFYGATFDTNGKPGKRLVRDSSVGVNRFRFR